MSPWLCAALALTITGCAQKQEPPPEAPRNRHTEPAQPIRVEAPAEPKEADGIDASLSEASPIPDAAQQLMVSVTGDWSATDAQFLRYQRQSGEDWQLVATPFASTIGHAGLGWGRGRHERSERPGEPVKREGDGRSPAGVFAIGKAYGYDPASKDTTLPYQRTNADWRCVNDSASRYYNRVIDSSGVDKDWSEAEKMRRRDELYRLVVEVDHNRIVPAELAPVPQGGSCIFLHIWRKPGKPTIGCTAMSIENMRSILSWLDPALHPHFVALPKARYLELRKAWQLPALPEP